MIKINLTNVIYFPTFPMLLSEKDKVGFDHLYNFKLTSWELQGKTVVSNLSICMLTEITVYIWVMFLSDNYSGLRFLTFMLET